MTQPPPGQNVQLDMGRVVRRAATGAAQIIADLTAELAMAREVIEQQQARIGHLEEQAAPAHPVQPPTEPVPPTS